MDSMSDIPDQGQVAADEQRIAALLRAVEAPAPVSLQRAIAERAAAPSPARKPWWRGAPAIGLGIAGAAAAACVALVLALTSGPAPAAPTVLHASLVALERPTGPAPASLVASGTSIVFPDWASLGWPRAGTRADRVGGRAVTTEFFRSYESGTVGYAIVAGSPLPWGAGGTTTTEGGQRYAVIASGGATIVT
jgi:hypothetical protein